MATEKAGRILQMIKLYSKAAKPWRLFRKSETRERVLGEFNPSTLDPGGPVRPAEQQMRGLCEMKELGEAEE
jgi:hypothetical protein